MRSAHVPHGMHTAVEPAEPAPSITHPGGVPPATIRSAPAMNRGGIFTVNSRAFTVDRRALSMDRVGIVRMHGSLIRPIGVADEPPEVQPVVVRDFTPALAPLMQRDNVVETLASGVRQQMRFL
jgi:hypothetical protein